MYLMVISGQQIAYRRPYGGVPIYPYKMMVMMMMMMMIIREREREREDSSHLSNTQRGHISEKGRCK
jgi:preprotein translocase subunit YajC